jgi:hypothetical protein
MPVIKTNASGEVITRNGRPSCVCCELTELAITYDWTGTDMTDLDTQTAAFSETVGYSCGDSGTYVLWLIGGDGATDDTSKNGFERVNVKVDTAISDGLWSSSYNIECFAGWYTPQGGSGYALLKVSYKGDLKLQTISPGTQSACASTPVATITVYATVQPDGTFFEIT